MAAVEALPGWYGETPALCLPLHAPMRASTLRHCILRVLDANKVRIRELGGLDPLVDCLESENMETRRLALRTLCNMSFDDRNNEEIRSIGGIAPIINCLFPDANGAEDVETTRAALRTLCNLSINGTAGKEVGKQSRPQPPLWPFLTAFGCSVDADENKREIRLLGGLLPIVECLQSEDVRTRRDALRTICNLSIDGM